MKQRICRNLAKKYWHSAHFEKNQYPKKIMIHVHPVKLSHAGFVRIIQAIMNKAFWSNDKMNRYGIKRKEMQTL